MGFGMKCREVNLHIFKKVLYKLNNSYSLWGWMFVIQTARPIFCDDKLHSFVVPTIRTVYSRS